MDFPSTYAALVNRYVPNRSQGDGAEFTLISINLIKIGLNGGQYSGSEIGK
jgi:hypothetical protein